ncbi:MAG: methyltransferase [Paludibacteraceae bacterium]|nr:methyltransferase [Paludibacteraceae bacterium]
MSTPFFRFRQFTVWHDRCAMKVNTDGVLLGAWTAIPTNNTTPIRCLDIGTGSGVVALMLAQRCQTALIDAIDIEPTAALQAQHNFTLSPWHNRLKAQHLSLNDLLDKRHQQTDVNSCQSEYCLVVSNPPFFADALPSPNKERRLARQTDTLSFHHIIAAAAELLIPFGRLSLILPAQDRQSALTLAAQHSLYLTRLTQVQPSPAKPSHRILIEWEYRPCTPLLTSDTYPAFTVPYQSNNLCIASHNAPRSEEYASLTKDFYLF